MTGKQVLVGGRQVDVSKLDKVLFPDDGITKGELIEHYERVADRMVPLVAGRPVSMERYPDGINGERFFQKRIPKYFPEWVERARVGMEGGSLEHPVIEHAATLVYLANQACITPHVWLSRADALDRPTDVIFDLDPEEDGFEQARSGARTLRTVLEDELRLPSFLKTTGGKGLHVSVPLDRRADFGAVHAFALDVAEVLIRREPAAFTIERRKAKRAGRLYVDVDRNAWAQTAVPAYGVRPRPQAPVATPLDWSELEDRRLTPTTFSLRTLERRLRDGDPWSGMRRRARSLTAARRRLDRLLAELR
jgi:bifunctional non-homologous end joining protein LigD